MNNDMEREMLESYAPRQRRQESQVENLRLAQMRARGLKSFAIPGRPNWFWVRGHELQVRDGQVIFCDCPSVRYRVTCLHAERVNMRLGFMRMR